MSKKIFQVVLIFLVLAVLYLLLKPVPIEPVAWQAPINPGYTGVYQTNDRLKDLEIIPIDPYSGPEDIVLDEQGRIYAATHDGTIIRFDRNCKNLEAFANSKGLPLGMAFDNHSNLIVADSYEGLLSIDPLGKVTVLTKEADGKPILFANNVDVARDGKIYFSDASTKFGAKRFNGTYEACLFDLMEHGGHGRLLVYDPALKTTRTLLDGINFANGVAISQDESFVLLNETGSYRIIRYYIKGPKKGEHDIFTKALPAFPDNITTGLNGLFWVALVSPRNPLLDNLSTKPFLRKVVQRLPAFLRPKAKNYGHIIAIDNTGKVVHDLQGPDTKYPINTSVTETKDYLYIGSLFNKNIARLLKK